MSVINWNKKSHIWQRANCAYIIYRTPIRVRCIYNHGAISAQLTLIALDGRPELKK